MSEGMNSEKGLGEIRLSLFFRVMLEGYRRRKQKVVTSVFCTDVRISFYIHTSLYTQSCFFGLDFSCVLANLPVIS